MISREQADELIRRWAGAEEAEIRKHWYPAVSPSLREYSGGYRESSAAVELDEEVLHWAGAAVRALQARYPEDYAVLLRCYVDGAPVGPRAKRMMLDRFALVYAVGSFP